MLHPGVLVFTYGKFKVAKTFENPREIVDIKEAMTALLGPADDVESIYILTPSDFSGWTDQAVLNRLYPS